MNKYEMLSAGQHNLVKPSLLELSSASQSPRIICSLQNKRRDESLSRSLSQKTYFLKGQKAVFATKTAEHRFGPEAKM